MVRNIRRFYAKSLLQNLPADSGFVYDSAPAQGPEWGSLRHAGDSHNAGPIHPAPFLMCLAASRYPRFKPQYDDRVGLQTACHARLLVVRIRGIACAWIGPTIAFGAVVRKP